MKKSGEGRGDTAVDRKKIPCVSPGMGEMKCEQRNGREYGSGGE